MTDELKQAEDRILSSSEKSLRLEIELFEKIKEVLASQLGALKRLAGAIAMLDCLTAFASLAKESGYCRPQIAEEGAALRITDGGIPSSRRSRASASFRTTPLWMRRRARWSLRAPIWRARARICARRR